MCFRLRILMGSRHKGNTVFIMNKQIYSELFYRFQKDSFVWDGPSHVPFVWMTARVYAMRHTMVYCSVACCMSTRVAGIVLIHVFQCSLLQCSPASVRSPSWYQKIEYPSKHYPEDESIYPQDRLCRCGSHHVLYVGRTLESTTTNAECTLEQARQSLGVGGRDPQILGKGSWRVAGGSWTGRKIL